jgi:charged multivesicular body protein 7
MLKRKPSHELDGSPHVLNSIFGDDPTRRQRKRLFRPKNHNKHIWQPEKEPAMTELLDFILQHEEAFKKYAYTQELGFRVFRLRAANIFAANTA